MACSHRCHPRWWVENMVACGGCGKARGAHTMTVLTDWYIKQCLAHVSKLNNDVNCSSPSTLPHRMPLCEKTGFSLINSHRQPLHLCGRQGWRTWQLWTSWCLERSQERLLVHCPGTFPRPLLLSAPAGPSYLLYIHSASIFSDLVASISETTQNFSSCTSVFWGPLWVFWSSGQCDRGR